MRLPGSRPVTRVGSVRLRPSTRISTRRPTRARFLLAGVAVLRLEERDVAALLDVLGDVVGLAARGERGGADAVREDVRLDEARCARRARRRLEVLVGLAGEADDEVRRDLDVGDVLRAPSRRPRGTAPTCSVRLMRSRARASEPDCAGMCSQGITFGTAPKRRIMSSVMSKRVAGEEADAVEAGDVARRARGARREPALVGASFAVGVDVLPEERDLAHAVVDEARAPRRARPPAGATISRAARERDDAVGADVVAAAHDGDVGACAVRAHGDVAVRSGRCSGSRRRCASGRSAAGAREVVAGRRRPCGSRACRATRSTSAARRSDLGLRAAPCSRARRCARPGRSLRATAARREAPDRSSACSRTEQVDEQDGVGLLVAVGAVVARLARGRRPRARRRARSSGSRS